MGDVQRVKNWQSTAKHQVFQRLVKHKCSQKTLWLLLKASSLYPHRQAFCTSVEHIFVLDIVHRDALRLPSNAGSDCCFTYLWKYLHAGLSHTHHLGLYENCLLLSEAVNLFSKSESHAFKNTGTDITTEYRAHLMLKTTLPDLLPDLKVPSRDTDPPLEPTQLKGKKLHNRTANHYEAVSRTSEQRRYEDTPKLLLAFIMGIFFSNVKDNCIPNDENVAVNKTNFTEGQSSQSSLKCSGSQQQGTPIFRIIWVCTLIVKHFEILALKPESLLSGQMFLEELL
ncbi:hypothetical protein Anapl_03803 [Anas platyrhynchos]|uniref:Uncharacterized protein n=1 Tax=Anas platyrhynchos TaxID=8839 RepID=R0KBQ9_ANAPL|nr:hypothetical protein Anapl_03803 [Anas platyrhynchos]